MHPILLKIGPFNIYSYGVMVAIGFGISTFLILRRAAEIPSFGIGKDKIIDITVLILIAGILGARALYIMVNFKHYMANPLEIPNLSRGGLIWYGGFLSAFLALIWYSKRNLFNFWSIADLIAPYIAMAQAFGRIGCFLNGCCYGIDGHPTQIYSSLLLFMIFAALRVWQDKRHFAGEIFLGYCLLYSTKRFLIEFLRGDNPRPFLGLTMAQISSIMLFMAASSIFLYKAAKWRKNRSVSR